MHTKTYEDLASKVTFAFQPIVNIHNGKTFAFEALIRDVEKCGFNSIDDFFNYAYNQNFLHSLDLLLREKCVSLFKKIKVPDYVKLFYNLDNRILNVPDFRSGATAQILEKENFQSENLCFEISEKQELFIFGGSDNATLNFYKSQGYQIAIDDFGTGFSGFKLLYGSEPNFIKIDRFFISELESNNKKKLFVSKMVELANSLGVKIIAEGVETKEEFFTCKDLGCAYVQGFFVQKPTKTLSNLSAKSSLVQKLCGNEKRGKKNERLLISKVSKFASLYEKDSTIGDVFAVFKANHAQEYVPILDKNNYPVGIINEQELKNYTYSLYGKSLVETKSVKDYMRECVVVDVKMGIEKIIKIYVQNKHKNLIVVKNDKYIGTLGSRTLLDIINEHNLDEERDKNPLTKLQGNNSIHRFLSKVSNDKKPCLLAYFDFDNFKPFNDTYGFRNGDRAILLFADLIKKGKKFDFLAHIGGDDFFVGIQNDEFEKNYRLFYDLCLEYKISVQSLYSKEDRQNGFIEAKDRFGETRKFPLLNVSLALLEIKNNFKHINSSSFDDTISTLKHEAKSINDDVKIACACIAG